MIAFAYDGTLNGDWVAHYAVRLAANTPERRLRLLHVRDDAVSAELEERIARIDHECKLLGIELVPELVRPGKSGVAQRLLDLMPASTEDMLVCGTRARPRNMTFLAGTVSARLLEVRRFPVTAFRVVHPGVLGQPGRVLLPLAGHPRGARYALALLRLFGADLEQLHVLFVQEVSRLRLRLLSRAAEGRLIRGGRAFVVRVEEELRAGLAPCTFELDASIVVSDDVPREILVHAGKLRSRLVCLGTSERTLPERVAYGNPIERVLRDARCDVAVYRSVD